jgi:uncharacterized protein (TIGR02301 family)
MAEAVKIGTTRGRWARVLLAALLVAAAIPAPTRAAEETPYDDRLAELAETLGALHHLRPLCGAAEAQTWRDQMAALLEAEQPSRERRQRLIDRFNQSYRGLAAAHRRCDPAARALAEIYRRRGEEIGADLVSRWGHR